MTSDLIETIGTLVLWFLGLLGFAFALTVVGEIVTHAALRAMRRVRT